MMTTFIVEDQPALSYGLEGLLNNDPEIEVLGTAANGQILLEKLKAKQPDLILMDLKMKVMNGIDATKAVKKLYPHIKILVFSTFMEIEDIRTVINLGVEGYLVKDVDNDNLVTIIKDVIGGEHYYDDQVTELLRSAPPPQPPKNPKQVPLTKKEKEVALLIAAGKSLKEIAVLLKRSPHTIDSHRKSIYKKLGVDKAAKLGEYIRSGRPL